ncbi:MAG: asparaginase [Putridiphycobacter sp.]
MSKDSKILIIYTGGTIGMINDPKTGRLKPFDFDNLYKSVPELKQFHYQLDVNSISNPIDSSEVNVKVWKEIANTIFDKYDDYDGFVILHGSDTMAYTASALSFMLQGLKKPIILTGSQLPIGQIRTDGKENLITAIEIAGLKNEMGEALVQEVAIYFEYSLYRGNRASKVSATHFEAFDSPNYPPLAVAGISIEFNENFLFITHKNELELFTDFNSKVGLIQLFPSMPIELIKSVFNKNAFDAVIIEAFGSGNTFSSEAFSKILNQFVENKGVVIVKTQCIKGNAYLGKYDTSQMFVDAGVINGQNITTEALITKTMYALGKYKTHDEQMRFLSKNCCGEQSE